ncbi:MAG: endopeptidase La [Spirochaetales bacterium]|nr:MAG: endopeptidase La [Spirochaetales bacterium]
MSILDSLRPRGDAMELPLIYVRETVVFPNALSPVLAGTRFCSTAADVALKADKRVFVSLLKNIPADGDNNIDVNEIGTIAHVVQAVRLADGSVRLLVEGLRRARLKRTVFRKDYLGAVVEPLEEDDLPGEGDGERAAMIQVIRKDFLVYADLVKKIPAETVQAIQRSESTGRLCDMVGNAVGLKVEKKQELLSMTDGLKRLEATATALAQETELLSMQKRISQKVRSRMERSQKEYFLQEQLKEINKELGKDGEQSENAELEKRIADREPPAEVMEKARRELAKLAKLQTLSPEAGVIRGYIEWLADLPWTPRKTEAKSLSAARAILDEDHYGMKKAKERILEFIAVRRLNERIKGPILCLVGPPGTGKTSLGRSIARALDRDFVRVSLGGVRDEAEIRGHRKTYVGALPGKILQSMRKAGSSNPVFLLDEIDKMSSDFRGDPASALLEVLDPEQNVAFVDHYLEVAYDLSSVVFVTTANSLHSIPYPLLDRMETIEMPGYSEYEKLEIAKNFILPRQMIENGLASSGVKIRDDAILEIIRHYTMESGVRSLEREIAHVIRKTAEAAVEAGCADTPDGVATFKRVIRADSTRKLLGKRRHESDLVFSEPGPGLACGLAWTELGGTVLPVEASTFIGEGELILTGNLGEVMKESARAAVTYLRARGDAFGLGPKDFAGRTLHVHVPEGAIPKDGPSAGITLAAAILSALTGKPLEPGWAMTGEITLTGRLLAIGGVKEKVLAAHRNKIFKLLLPEANRKDLDDIPPEVSRDIEFSFASTVTEALAVLAPGAKRASPKKARPSVKGGKRNGADHGTAALEQ